jgi:hypothetical protein
MTSHSDISAKRVAKWISESKPVSAEPIWQESRLAIDFGGHTYIITNGQIFQCAHCGTYDPQWNATEVVTYFRDKFGIKPYTIQVTCSITVAE